MRLTWLRFRREFASDWLSLQDASTTGHPGDAQAQRCGDRWLNHRGLGAGGRARRCAVTGRAARCATTAATAAACGGQQETCAHGQHGAHRAGRPCGGQQDGLALPGTLARALGIGGGHEPARALAPLPTATESRTHGFTRALLRGIAERQGGVGGRHGQQHGSVGCGRHGVFCCVLGLSWLGLALGLFAADGLGRFGLRGVCRCCPRLSTQSPIRRAMEAGSFARLVVLDGLGRGRFLDHGDASEGEKRGGQNTTFG